MRGWEGSPLRPSVPHPPQVLDDFWVYDIDAESGDGWKPLHFYPHEGADAVASLQPLTEAKYTAYPW